MQSIDLLRIDVETKTSSQELSSQTKPSVGTSTGDVFFDALKAETQRQQSSSIQPSKKKSSADVRRSHESEQPEQSKELSNTLKTKTKSTTPISPEKHPKQAHKTASNVDDEQQIVLADRENKESRAQVKDNPSEESTSFQDDSEPESKREQQNEQTTIKESTSEENEEKLDAESDDIALAADKVADNEEVDGEQASELLSEKVVLDNTLQSTINLEDLEQTESTHKTSLEEIDGEKIDGEEKINTEFSKDNLEQLSLSESHDTASDELSEIEFSEDETSLQNALSNDHQKEHVAIIEEGGELPLYDMNTEPMELDVVEISDSESEKPLNITMSLETIDETTHVSQTLIPNVEQAASKPEDAEVAIDAKIQSIEQNKSSHESKNQLTDSDSLKISQASESDTAKPMKPVEETSLKQSLDVDNNEVDAEINHRDLRVKPSIDSKKNESLKGEEERTGMKTLPVSDGEGDVTSKSNLDIEGDVSSKQPIKTDAQIIDETLSSDISADEANFEQKSSMMMGQQASEKDIGVRKDAVDTVSTTNQAAKEKLSQSVANSDVVEQRDTSQVQDKKSQRELPPHLALDNSMDSDDTKEFGEILKQEMKPQELKKIATQADSILTKATKPEAKDFTITIEPVIDTKEQKEQLRMQSYVSSQLSAANVIYAQQSRQEQYVMSLKMSANGAQPTSTAAQKSEMIQAFNDKFAPVMRQHVMMMMQRGKHQAEIRLDPPELGRINVHIQMQGDQTQVQFNVQQAQTKDMLEQSMHKLKEMIENQGYTLTEGHVDQQANQFAKRQFQSQRRGGSEGVEGVQEEALSAPSSNHDGLIDCYA